MRRQDSSRKKIILGITGSFGSGKTTVAKIFKYFGVKVIDADKIAHSIIKPRSKIYKKIINTFGRDILRKNKTINRYKLAKIVFNNKSLLKRLNKIMHPEIIRIINEKIITSRSKFIVLDAPLLIEAGLRDMMDKLIVVRVKRKQQMQRLLNKTSLTKGEISKRISHQIPLKNKVRIADFIIDNSGTIKNTKKQIDKIMLRLRLSNFDSKLPKASEASQVRRLLWKN